jgi:uncharacterized protein YbjT (DUF2867 family)
VRQILKEIGMKIVVIGGSGLIGSKLVEELAARGHQVLAASPRSGVNTVTGQGLAQALEGASVVVDVSNPPLTGSMDVTAFFTASNRNLLAQEATAGVTHHVALSVVGAERLAQAGAVYMEGKLAQERLIRASSIPYTIARATQFHEFMGAIAEAGVDGDVLRLSSALIQPIAGDDVASALCEIAVGAPLRGMVELAGPDKFRLDELVRLSLEARRDARRVVTDPQAGYFGAKLRDRELCADDGARLGATHFADWVKRS